MRIKSYVGWQKNIGTIANTFIIHKQSNPYISFSNKILHRPCTNFKLNLIHNSLRLTFKFIAFGSLTKAIKVLNPNKFIQAMNIKIKYYMMLRQTGKSLYVHFLYNKTFWEGSHNLQKWLKVLPGVWYLMKRVIFHGNKK